MAELSKYPIPEGRFIRGFPPAYNTIHGTRFSGEPERPEVEQGWDYRWPNPDDPGSPLEVQHTAGASGTNERVHPKNVSAIVKAVSEHMKQAGYGGYHASVHCNNTPQDHQTLKKLTATICSEVDAAITRGLSPGQSLRFGGKWIFKQQSGRYDVRLESTPTFKHPSVTCSMSFFEDTTRRLTGAVRHKSDQVGYAKTDIVLVVDLDLMGYDLEDLHDLKQSLVGLKIPFREVWVADLQEDTKFHRVWP